MKNERRTLTRNLKYWTRGFLLSREGEERKGEEREEREGREEREVIRVFPPSKLNHYYFWRLLEIKWGTQCTLMLDTASLKPCSVLFYWKKKLAKRGSFTNSIIHKFKTPNLNRSYRNIKQTLTEILSPISLKFFSFFSPKLLASQKTFNRIYRVTLIFSWEFWSRSLVTQSSKRDCHLQRFVTPPESPLVKSIFSFLLCPFDFQSPRERENKASSCFCARVSVEKNWSNYTVW